MTFQYKERLFIKSYEYDLLNHKNKMLHFWLETKKRYVEKLYGKTVIEPNMSKKVNKFKKYPKKKENTFYPRSQQQLEKLHNFHHYSCE